MSSLNIVKEEYESDDSANNNRFSTSDVNHKPQKHKNCMKKVEKSLIFVVIKVILEGAILAGILFYFFYGYYFDKNEVYDGILIPLACIEFVLCFLTITPK